MDSSDLQVIVFFLIAVFAIICSIIVITHIFASNSLQKILAQGNIKTFQILILHITVLVDSFTSLPFLWTNSGNHGFCEFIGWLKFYCSLCNVLVIFFMGLHYFSWLSLASYSNQITAFLENRRPFPYAYYSLLFGFPLITLFPLITSSYGIQNDLWCTLPTGNKRGNRWAFFVLYFWIFLLLIFSIGQFCVSYYSLMKLKLLNILHEKLFISFGSYFVIAIICWFAIVVPRFINNVKHGTTTDSLLLNISYPLYISAIGYAVMYWINWRLKIIIDNFNGEGNSLSNNKDGSNSLNGSRQTELGMNSFHVDLKFILEDENNDSRQPSRERSQSFSISTSNLSKLSSTSSIDIESSNNPMMNIPSLPAAAGLENPPV